MSLIEEKVESLISIEINKLMYDLYDIEYVKEGSNYFLKIYIDKNTGIDLNDCEKVSKIISDLLDTVDIIKEQYFLEVSSPGIERILRKEKHFKMYIGTNVSVKLFSQFNEKKYHEGILNNFNDNYLELNCDNNIIKFDRKNISQVKTIYNWL